MRTFPAMVLVALASCAAPGAGEAQAPATAAASAPPPVVLPPRVAPPVEEPSASAPRLPWPVAMAPGYSAFAQDSSSGRPVWPVPVSSAPAPKGSSSAAPSAPSSGAIVGIQDVRVDGALPADDASMFVMSLLGRLRSCYEAALAADHTIKGSMAIRMVVGSNGSVVQVARGATDLSDPRLMQCLLRSNEALRFPKPATGAASVGYRVVLEHGRRSGD